MTYKAGVINLWRLSLKRNSVSAHPHSPQRVGFGKIFAGTEHYAPSCWWWHSPQRDVTIVRTVLSAANRRQEGDIPITEKLSNVSLIVLRAFYLHNKVIFCANIYFDFVLFSLSLRLEASVSTYIKTTG